MRNRFILAFIIMQLIGAGGLALILLTALVSRRVKRHSTWYSFTASWIFSCLCYCLLFLAGQQVGAPPDETLCGVQAALVYAAPVLTACTTLSLVIHMYLNFRSLLYKSAFDVRPVTELMLLGVPYLVWGIVFVGVILFELQNPGMTQLSPRGTYCDSNLRTLSHMSSSVVMIVTAVMTLLLGVLGYRIIRNRRSMLKEGLKFAMLFRVVAFSVIGISAFVLAVTFVITDNHDTVFDMLLASVPLLAMLIFGSQLDLLRVWTCRRGAYVPASLKAVDDDESRRSGLSGYTPVPDSRSYWT